VEFIIHRFDRVTSTNDVAGRMAEEGAPEGMVIVALEQTRGRGRHGRSWVSPPASGLYLTLILRPGSPFEELWQLAFACSLAAAEAVEDVSGLRPALKWPNDVMLNGRKVCGLLVETRKSAGGGQPSAVSHQPSAVTRHPSPVTQNSSPKTDQPTPWRPRPVLVGIGINVNNSEFPGEIAECATSMALESGRRLDLLLVEQSLLGAIDARYSQYVREGFLPILAAWKEYDMTSGREVAVHTSDGVVKGTALEVDADGNLVLRLKGGGTARVTAGEVVIATGAVE